MEKLNKDPSTRLFVGGIPYRITEGELLDLFAPFGRVVSLKIMHTKWGKSRGLGFVEFDNLDSAISAKIKLHNYKIDIDRTIIVDYAEPDPFKTEEGQARHQEAVTRKEARYAKFPKTAPTAGPKHGSSASSAPFKRKPVFGKTRQSTYDSRTHHSKVGSKFAKRTRGK
jgi:RNA recognition motif-containing protein